MTDLKCSVTQCASNCDSLCALHSIQVDGAAAATKTDTTCSSFQQRSSAPTNAVSNPSAAPETEVRCDAADCQYNQAKACSASYIYVQGGGSGTHCETFKARS